MLGIGITAFNRPKYLSIALESLSRVKGIMDCKVGIYIDSPFDSKVYHETLGRITAYPFVSRIIFHNPRVGIGENHLYAFRDLFTIGCDPVLQLEDDLIVRSDILDYIYSPWERNAFFYGLSRLPSDEDNCYDVGGFGTQGLLMYRNSFVELDKWLSSGQYWGLSNVDNSFYHYEIEGGLKVHWDTFVSAISRQKRLLRLLPPLSYIFHFGVRSSVLDDSVNISEIKQWEARVFVKRQTSWLNNLLLNLNVDDMPYVNKYLYPKDFKYV